jgi:hypothetical protein
MNFEVKNWNGPFANIKIASFVFPKCPLRLFWSGNINSYKEF